MRKFLRSALRLICILAIAAGCVASLASLLVVAAMSIAWAHDGRLIANDETILTRGVAWLAASSVFVCVVAWLYRSLLGDRDDTLRIVPSRSARPERKSGGPINVLFFTILAFVVHGLVPAGALHAPIAIGWLCVAFAGIHAHIFLHELGHLMIAYSLRFKLGALYVGDGPLLASRTLANGMRIVWRLWPRCGFAHASYRGGSNPRIRQMLFIAGGPLADVTIVVLGYLFIARFWGGYREALTHSAGSFVAAALLFEVFFIALNGLIPQTFRTANRIAQTDGWHLLRTWLAPRGVIGFAGDPSWLEALPLLQTPEPVSQSLSCEPVRFRAQQARLQSRLRPADCRS